MATCAIGGASHCGYVPITKLRSSANSSLKRTLILSGYGIGPELFRKCGTEMKYKRCTADPSKPKVLVKGANKSLMNQRITRQLNYFPSSAVMLDSCGYEPTFCRPASLCANAVPFDALSNRARRCYISFSRGGCVAQTSAQVGVMCGFWTVFAAWATCARGSSVLWPVRLRPKVLRFGVA